MEYIGLNYNGNKGFRLLSINERLNKGEMLNKAELARNFNVTLKTIQRDIDDLRAYFAETHFTDADITIKYNKTKNVYYLVKFEREWLTNEEVLALCKIILESRAFNINELDRLLDKLLEQVMPIDRKIIHDIIKCEKHYLMCYNILVTR